MLFQRRLHATDDELSAYLDGALAGRVRERVGGHVDACAICQETLAGLRAVQASLRRLRANAPRSFAVREAALRPVPARPATGLSLATPLLSGVTAMALIAFFAVVSFDMSGGDFNTSSKKASSRNGELSAASAQDASAPLPGAVDAGSPAAGEQATDNAQRLTVTASGAAFYTTSAPPSATPAPIESVSTGDDGDNDDMKLRIAEGALALAALVSGGSALVLVRRRRA